jgi:DNA ligase-1
MDYCEMVDLYQKLESTTKKLEMTDILAGFLKKVRKENVYDCTLLILGRVFPEWSDQVVGIASSLMVKSLKKATGLSESEIVRYWKESGDLGIAAEKSVSKKRQTTLSRKKISLEKIVENIRKMASFEGPGTIEKKTDLIAELIASASPEESKYITRTVLGVLRMGVGAGILRDAIASAFNVEAKMVERALYLSSDFGEVAQTTMERGEKGLKEFRIKVGRPIMVMLAQRASDLEDGFSRVGKPCAIEFKYDGMRVQIHKKNKETWVFTRRLENVTKQFPEIVAASKRIKCDECILEGEAVGFDPKTGKHIPFQKISRRIKRKYDIKEMANEIPTETKIFDITFLNGKEAMSKKFSERRKMVERLVEPRKREMVLSDQIVTSDVKEAEDFYKKALESGEEGIMMKNLEAEYVPGSRVGYMVKLKPDQTPLDLVIVGAEWGEGKRANWLSSFLLACYDSESDRFLTIGKMATGLTDEQFREITEKLKPLVVSEKGRKVVLKPETVVEIGFQEIQKSPTYESGFALRFPRLMRIRDDKRPEEADGLESIRQAYGGARNV